MREKRYGQARRPAERGAAQPGITFHVVIANDLKTQSARPFLGASAQHTRGATLLRLHLLSAVWPVLQKIRL